MIEIGERLIAFSVPGAGKNAVGITVPEDNVGKKAVAIPDGQGGRVLVRPYNAYVGDKGLILPREKIFLPGKPPNYLPESWKVGIPISCSQGAPQLQEDGSYYLPAGSVTISTRVLLRKATEGIESLSSPGVLVVVIDDVYNLHAYGYGDGAVRLPISPDNRDGFGKMGDYVTVVAHLEIGGGYSYDPTPQSVSGIAKVVTVGRF